MSQFRIVEISRGWVPQLAVVKEDEKRILWFFKKKQKKTWMGIDYAGTTWLSFYQQYRYCCFSSKEEAEEAIERYKGGEERKKKENKDIDILSLD